MLREKNFDDDGGSTVDVLASFSHEMLGQSRYAIIMPTQPRSLLPAVLPPS